MIATLLPPGFIDRLEGFSATRERFLSAQLSQYRYIHVASHGLVDAEIPQPASEGDARRVRCFSEESVQARLERQRGAFGQAHSRRPGELPNGVTQFGQGSPFGQIGYPLAPQSWIGPQSVAGGTPFGQTNPLLSQLTGRGFQGHGISPWSAF